MSFRVPEQPIWALMLKPNCEIAAVREEDAHLKLSCGWLIVARESDLLPFNPPRLIPDDEPFPAVIRRKRDDDGA